MRILVVEDEVKLAKLVKQVLEEERHQVDVANEGDTGLEMAIVGSYDLIVLDLMLPGVSGLEICRTLRQERNSTPILMLTARDAVSDRVMGLDAGADDYLTKPFAFEELLARIRSVVRRKVNTEVLTQNILQVADLKLDLVTRQVTRGNKTIELTEKEFALLEFLLQNAGRVLNRNQIIDRVWEYDFDATSNVVDIYIHYLRSKIDEGHRNKLIKTIRGVGYTLRAD